MRRLIPQHISSTQLLFSWTETLPRHSPLQLSNSQKDMTIWISVLVYCHRRSATKNLGDMYDLKMSRLWAREASSFKRATRNGALIARGRLQRRRKQEWLRRPHLLLLLPRLLVITTLQAAATAATSRESRGEREQGGEGRPKQHCREQKAEWKEKAEGLLVGCRLLVGVLAVVGR